MIGKRLKKLRIEKDISQKELSDILDIVISNVSMYESNNRTPSPEILIKMSKYFNVSVDYLLGLTTNRHSNLEVPENYFAVLSEVLEEGISPEKLKKLIQFAKDIET